MRSRGYCKTCMKYVCDNDLIRCRDAGHIMVAHERDYMDWLSKKRLEESQNIRKKIIEKYGYVPESFDTNVQRDRVLDAWIDDLAKGTYPLYGWGSRSGALSQIPATQTKQSILMYSEKGDIVLNPTMGRAGHLLIANYFGRKALGQDICKKFYFHSVEKIKHKIMSSQKLFPKNNGIVKETPDMFSGILQGQEMEIHLGDSRNLSWLKDEYVDYVVMSPPYWNIEFYGPEKEQIGTGSVTYEEFLGKLKDIFRECFRVLKRGKFISVLVNDFRYKKKFYMYHCDTIRLLNDVGFINHDIRIYKVGTLSSIFASELERDKRSAKTSEYIIVMRKPGERIEEKDEEIIEEDIYESDEERIIKSVDRDKLSQQGSSGSLNFYKKRV